MNQIFSSAYYPLWIAHPVMQVALAVVMWRRKLLRTYPSFFAYIVSEVMLFLVLFLNEKHADVYYYLYWIGAAIGAVLGFKVIHEVFSDVLRPFHALKDFSSMLFRWAALVVMLIAVMAAMGSPNTGLGSVALGLLSLERSVRVMQCGLVLFLLMFSRYLGSSWRHRSFGIALGFGIFAVVEFVLLGLQFASLIDRTTLNLLNMGAYDAAVLIWLVYAIAPAHKQEPTAVLLQPQRWDLSLSELAHPLAPESLMPMFDAMVDRAFSKAGAAPQPAGPVAASGTRTPTAKEASASGSRPLTEAALAAAHRSS
ncbi:MAG TPA: hypothetical protein VJ756_04840 [Terriglobales bacterium]|nr:hypothetical protein [Terriglobales bacterium]